MTLRVLKKRGFDTYEECAKYIIADHPKSDSDTNAHIVLGLIASLKYKEDPTWFNLDDPLIQENIEIMRSVCRKNPVGTREEFLPKLDISSLKM